MCKSYQLLGGSRCLPLAPEMLIQLFCAGKYCFWCGLRRQHSTAPGLYQGDRLNIIIVTVFVIVGF